VAISPLFAATCGIFTPPLKGVEIYAVFLQKCPPLSTPPYGGLVAAHRTIEYSQKNHPLLSID